MTARELCPRLSDSEAADAETFRQIMVRKIPSWYSPWAHLAGTVGVGVVSLAIAIWQIRDLKAIELLTIPCVFILSNFIEWYVHKNVMHRRWRLMSVLYDRHTPEHHRVFRYKDMAIQNPRELRMVLIPAMGVLGIVLMQVPGALLAGFILNANVGWLFLLSSALYVVSYELTHLCYHLPEDSFIYRIGFVRVLREHHARHHEPSLMQRWNFNVTLPLADLVFRTIASDELIKQAEARRIRALRSELH